MRFHVVGLSHLPVSRRYMSCAFSQKTYKVCQMLMNLGHTVFLYGAESSDAPCSEFIETHTLTDIRESFGDADWDRWEGTEFEALGYDWNSEYFRHDLGQNKRAPVTLKYYQESIKAINARKKEDDFILLMQGLFNKPIADAVGLFLTVEPGIGYTGSYAPFRGFESRFIMYYTYGRENFRHGSTVNGKNYDRVIPNYFDPQDFTLETKKEDYLLFVGRLIHRKGLVVANMVAQHLDKRLVVAGQGATHWDGHTLRSEDTEISGDRIEYLGSVGAEERDRLMGRAQALFCPTIYLEPFGGVNVEAQLTGTPAIASAYGAFPETILQGKTGYCCYTLDDYIKAALAAPSLDPVEIREHAEQYLMDNVSKTLEKWFTDLYRVWESAKYPGQIKGWSHTDVPEATKPEKTKWEKAFAWQQAWWREHTKSFTNTLEEEEKQNLFGRRMGIPVVNWARKEGHWFDAKSRSILDIGGGGASLLLKTVNLGERRCVADPMPLPKWALDRYISRDIRYVQMKGEDLDFPGDFFDEVWIYNLLQYVEDPEAVIKNAFIAAPIIRIFEWIEVGIGPKNLHDLTKDYLDSLLGTAGTVENLGDKYKHRCYYGTFIREEQDHETD